MEYLDFADLDLEALNQRGLAKLLLTRREAIYLKNVMRLASQEPPELTRFLEDSRLTWPRYLRQLTHRLRAVLKSGRQAPRLDPDVLKSIGQPDPLRLAEKLQIRSLACLDFDRTLTDRGFREFYRERLMPMREYLQIWVVTAHGRREVVEEHVLKFGLEIRPSRILATGSVKEKKRALFELASKTDRTLLFSFDDEEPVARLARLFGYHAYVVVRPSTPKARSTVEPLLLS